MLAFYFRLSVFLWKKRKLGLHQGLKTSPSITRPSVNEFRKGWTWNEFSPQWPATASFSVNSNVTDLKYRIWQLEWRQEFEEILYMKTLFDFVYEISHKEFDLLDFAISYSILYNILLNVQLATLVKCEQISDNGFLTYRFIIYLFPL